ncbi:hypothetical protein Bca4012_102900 [Brassica carinata]
MDGAEARDLYPPPGKSQASMSRRARRSLQNLGREPGGAAAGADLGGSSKYSNENFEGRRGERFHVNGTCTWPAHPGNGSAGGRVQRLEEHRTPRGVRAFPRPLKIRRTECRHARQGKSAKWIRNFGKGLALRAGLKIPVPNPPTVGGLLELLTRESARRVSAGDGLGTALSEFLRRRTANSELCSECQSEEIQPSAVNGGVTMTLLSETTAKGTGLAESAGKEDPVELDSSPTL